MGKGRQQVTDALRTLSEDLDAISVSDRGAWEKLAAKVQRVAKAAAKPPGVKELLELAVQGLMQLAENPVPDMLGAVDALAGALQAAEQACGGKPGSDALAAACERLAAVFGPDGAGTAPAGTAEELTLDDAAALLMQLAATDTDGWMRLEDGLRRLAQDEDLPQSCRQHLGDAADLGVRAGGHHHALRLADAGRADASRADGGRADGPALREVPAGRATEAGRRRRQRRRLSRHARSHSRR